MTKLIWDQEKDRRYEFGVDHGVFYPPTGPGVVWNGLVGVTESSVGGEGNSYHYDGIKYLDTVNPRNYVSTIQAYGTPTQFRTACGEKAILPGFILTRQSRELFGLSYRTFVGPDEGGYKIHIVYNALASPNQRVHNTIERTGAAVLFSWKIEAVPPVQNEYRPSAHYIFDSMTMPLDVLGIIEDILYGSAVSEPRLPTLDELRSLITLRTNYVIVPQETTGLAELEPGVGDIYRIEIEGLHRVLPYTRLEPTSVGGIYRLEE